MMAGLPTDIVARVAQTLASGNKAAAADLAGQIAAAQASGSAMGFDDDLEKLQALAGTEALGKRAAAGDVLAKVFAQPLAPDVAARVQRVTAMAKAATSPSEVYRAKAEIEALSNDIRTHAAMRASLARPQTMGAAPL